MKIAKGRQSSFPLGV